MTQHYSERAADAAVSWLKASGLLPNGPEAMSHLESLRDWVMMGCKEPPRGEDEC